MNKQKSAKNVVLGLALAVVAVMMGVVAVVSIQFVMNLPR